MRGIRQGARAPRCSVASRAAAVLVNQHAAALTRIIEHVNGARADGTPLEIRGEGSKRFYGETPSGDPLELRELCGITSYEPTELVVTARAGTAITELEETL